MTLNHEHAVRILWFIAVNENNMAFSMNLKRLRSLGTDEDTICIMQLTIEFKQWYWQTWTNCRSNHFIILNIKPRAIITIYFFTKVNSDLFLTDTWCNGTTTSENRIIPTNKNESFVKTLLRYQYSALFK